MEPHELDGRAPEPSALVRVPGFHCDCAGATLLRVQFSTQGCKFCFRYLSTGLKSPPSVSEQPTEILNRVLGLEPVQPASQPGWLLTRALGEQHGQLERMPNKESGNPQQYGPFLGNPLQQNCRRSPWVIPSGAIRCTSTLPWRGRVGLRDRSSDYSYPLRPFRYPRT